jgi:hypothetical protein
MHHIILRDDDTNALTPPECLEELYRPFLDRGLPVNLAVIPNVRTDAMTLDGQLEGFLLAKNGEAPQTLPIGSNEKLVRYLLDNPGYHIMQHGYHHEPAEFDCHEREEIVRRLQQGALLLRDAGFPMPETFVAPHDKLSPAAFVEIAQRYRVISTGWFELRRLPFAWWPRYVLKKLLHRTHWRIGRTLLLGHPGCLLSCHRPYDQMFETVRNTVESRPLTVLVTHWWEYFRSGVLDHRFRSVLHQVADYLASKPDFKVVSCDALSDRRNRVAWN